MYQAFAFHGIFVASHSVYHTTYGNSSYSQTLKVSETFKVLAKLPERKPSRFTNIFEYAQIQ